jgi:hypothetical protein
MPGEVPISFESEHILMYVQHDKEETQNHYKEGP